MYNDYCSFRRCIPGRKCRGPGFLVWVGEWREGGELEGGGRAPVSGEGGKLESGGRAPEPREVLIQRCRLELSEGIL